MFEMLESAWIQLRTTLEFVPASVIAALVIAVSVAAAVVVARIADVVLRRAFAVGHSLLLHLEGPLRLAWCCLGSTLRSRPHRSSPR